MSLPYSDSGMYNEQILTLNLSDLFIQTLKLCETACNMRLEITLSNCNNNNKPQSLKLSTQRRVRSKTF